MSVQIITKAYHLLGHSELIPLQEACAFCNPLFCCGECYRYENSIQYQSYTPYHIHTIKLLQKLCTLFSQSIWNETGMLNRKAENCNELFYS